MNPAVERVLSRLSPKARQQAESELAKQGHPDFAGKSPASAPASPAQPSQEALMAHDPYDVTGGEQRPVKRKGTANAKAPAASTSIPDLPPIPTIQCHNTLPSLSLTLKHPLPSWNAILGLGHWQRARLKKAIQDDFLSALRASVADCSTRTTSARSTLSIAAATLDSYQRTMQERRRLKSRKSASARKRKNAPKS